MSATRSGSSSATSRILVAGVSVDIGTPLRGLQWSGERGGDRHGDGECRTRAGVAGDMDPAVLSFDHRLGDGQTETAAFDRGIDGGLGPVEPVEYPVDLARVDPDPGVADADPGDVEITANGDCDHTTLGCELECVAD